MCTFTEVGVIPPAPYVVSGSRPCPIQCSSDGKRIIYGTMTGVVSRCLPDQLDKKTKTVQTFVGNRTAIEVAAVSPDGLIIAGGNNNGTVYVWTKGRDGTTTNSYQLGMQYVRITDLSFDDESKRLAISGVDRYSKKLGTVIDVGAGNAIGGIEGHSMGINSITFRQKRPYLIATAGVDGLVCFHSGPPFKLISTFEGHIGKANCIRFSPDGDRLGSCGEDGRLIFWDVQNGRVDHTIELSIAALYGIAWTSDSARVVAVGADRGLRIVEALSGDVIDEMPLSRDDMDTPVRIDAMNSISCHCCLLCVTFFTDWSCVDLH